MNKSVCVTAIGSFSAVSVVQNLKAAGYRVIGTDIHEAEWIAMSRETDAFYQMPYAVQEDDYLRAILEMTEKEKISYIIPLTDAEVDVLNSHRDEIEAAGAVLCMSGKDVIPCLRSKMQMQKLAEKLLEEEVFSSIRSIPSYMADEIDYETITYPVIVKPVNGRSSEGLHRIYNEDQLGFAFSQIMDPEKLNDTTLTEYIVQPMIKGHVITVDVVRDDMGNCMAAAREELIRTPNGAGLSVRSFSDNQLSAFVKRLAEKAGVRGCVNFEFICGEGTGLYYFMECNPRFSGGVAFSQLMGADMVGSHMRVFEGREISVDETAFRYGYFARKYTEVEM